MEKMIRVLTVLGVIFTGIGETLKNFVVIQKSLDNKEKAQNEHESSNKANDYKSVDK